MGKLIGRLIINVFALFVVAFVLPGFAFESTSSLIVASVVIGVINTFIKPILHVITLPISIVTFGVFALVLNVGLLLLASYVVPGFRIDSFLTAFIASISLALVSWFLHKLAKD